MRALIAAYVNKKATSIVFHRLRRNTGGAIAFLFRGRW